MANKDFYDRIADALEIIVGDDSHIDDVDKNMDYYKRIAEALEKIAEDEGGGKFNNIFVVNEILDNYNLYLNKTWNEIHNALLLYKIVIFWFPQNGNFSQPNYGFILRAGQDRSNRYFVDMIGMDTVDTADLDSFRYYADTADSYPMED